MTAEIYQESADAVGAVEKARETLHAADIIEYGLILCMRKSRSSLRIRGKVMVGGASATQARADKIGADCCAENASEAVIKAKELLGN